MTPALLVYIQAHLDEDLSLDVLSAQASLSPAHFQRTFRALVGETPKSYVARLRLERAAFRLLIHDATLLDIALDCGFQNHETFTRAFRRRFGMPPNSYRAWVRTQVQQRSETVAEQPGDAYSISVTKIRRLQRAHLAFIRHVGPYQAVRSDVFSFGIVLHEILSGVRASGDGDAFRSAQVPPALARIVQRCLAANPQERFQTMAEVRAVLEHASTELTSGPGVRKPSIAVLPFANMSADKENEYFADGLAEEVINALAQVPGLQVAGRTSSFLFRGKEFELTEVGRRLNVEHLLEGSVRRAANRVRVTVQLIKAADGFHLWSERYDRELTDIFAIQDEITQAVASALRIRPSSQGYTRVTLALSPGTRLGVYEITAPIGEGGMGQVYRATDTTLSRHVAIKILATGAKPAARRAMRSEPC